MASDQVVALFDPGRKKIAGLSGHTMIAQRLVFVLDDITPVSLLVALVLSFLLLLNF